LNINSFHLPTKFSQPASLTTYTILSLFSLHVEPVLESDQKRRQEAKLSLG